MEVQTVSAFTRPYDYWYDRYQLFYREGLRSQCAASGLVFDETPITRLPRLLRPVRHVRDRYLSRLPGKQATSFLDRVAHTLEGPARTPSSFFHSIVGQYLVRTAGGATCRVCVDAADYPDLPCDELVSWSDLYFKANLWPSRTYPSNVLPIVNGDGLILNRIPVLRSYRAQPKECDVCFIVRVWGGRDELEGIEHNLRLLEAVSRARCSKVLIAYLVAGDVEAESRRLRSAGVTCTTRSIRPRTLWRLMGNSRLNIIRLGMHNCIPWRMAGALAMGACVVLDQPPISSWPEPLREDVNFLSLGAETVESPVADSGCYADIPAKIEEWLSEHEKLERIMSNNGDYYDRLVQPQRVGESTLASVEHYLSRSSRR